MPSDVPVVGGEVLFENAYKQAFIAFDVSVFGTDSK